MQTGTSYEARPDQDRHKSPRKPHRALTVVAAMVTGAIAVTTWVAVQPFGRAERPASPAVAEAPGPDVAVGPAASPDSALGGCAESEFKVARPPGPARAERGLTEEGWEAPDHVGLSQVSDDGAHCRPPARKPVETAHQ